MGSLSKTDKTKKYRNQPKSTKTYQNHQKTSKMHSFENNFASMLNSMMNQPQFIHHMQNFENEMRKCKVNAEKTQENAESSTPKTDSTPTTDNFSKTDKPKKQPTSISIPLKRFSPEQVGQLNMTKNGLITVTASRENTEESNRNGQRKTTIMVEETCHLPGYLVDHGLLGKVESKFHNGFLVVSFPEDPKFVEERENELRKNAPIEIPILMEE